MDIFWKKPRDRWTNNLGSRVKDLGDKMMYTCPSGTLTQEGLKDQMVTCIWHRQTDMMLWWPQDIYPCNSKYFSG